MESEKDKMLSGELYDPLDSQLASERRRARLLLKVLNDSGDAQQEEEQTNQAGCLNLLTNAVVAWNTVYMAVAIEQYGRRAIRSATKILLTSHRSDMNISTRMGNIGSISTYASVSSDRCGLPNR